MTDREEALDLAAFGPDGFAIVPNVVRKEDVVAACDAAEALTDSGRPRAGLRDPLQRCDLLRRVAELPAITSIAHAVLGPGAFVTRAILFDKSPVANWDVAWHQDVTIAVEQRDHVDGFGPWSTKDGVPHVQPLARVLEGMVTLRVHLDDCHADNGPLLVSPGSHRRGIIDVRSLDVRACERSAVACVVDAGDVVVMRPLMLHASRKSISPSHRRVLHLEFTAEQLPPPLRWRVA